ncbi:MAG: hypothetical protein COT18_09935 [Elusimicrobia bacterium CG08_land_8_20_14_0_20_59_10]|nr:MAG: hypothetical protein COT18_09935 [Elusimicrobia bacterium CG08_land_8_20_14_0_20_59_10]
MKRLVLTGLLLSAAAPQCRAYEYEFFNAGKGKVLTADPGQPLIRSLFTHGTGGYFSGQDFWDIGLGGDLPLLTARRGADEAAGLNVRGDFRSRFSVGSNSFNLLNTDYTGGLDLTIRKAFNLPGDLAAGLSHTSSHLGDEVLTDTAAYTYGRINYSREVLRVLYHPPLSGAFAQAWGAHYILRKDPGTPRGRLALQYNIAVPLGARFSANSDLQFNEEHAWTADFTLQLAVKLGGEAGQVFTQKLALEYYDGYSRQGQFHDRRERHVSIGIIAHI